MDNTTKAFLNSVDNPDDFDVFEMVVNSTKPIKIEVKATNKTFDDGAPHLKYFDRSENYVYYVFEPNKKLELIYEIDSDSIYWFENGNWYYLNESLDWLMEELNF